MTRSGTLSAAFLQGLAPSERSRVPAEGLEETLLALVRRGRAAWPDLAVEPEAFVGFLAGRVRSGKAAPTEFPQVEDLFLCHACLARSAGAMSAFESAHFANLPSHLSQLAPTSDFLKDVEQTLRAKLFVSAEGREMGLAAYTGRGPLGAWFRVTALNTALKLLRAEMKDLRRDTRSPAPRTSTDPERDLIRARTRAELEETLRSVLAQAPARERALLRLHFVNGSTLDELSKIFRVHRATIARWIANARQSVLQETQRRMIEQLKLSPSEMSSNFRISRSDWSLSLGSTLAPEKKKPT